MEDRRSHHLLKLFFRYACRLLIYIENDRIMGVVRKDDIESHMSDLDNTNLIQRPPVMQLSGLEHLIDLFQSEAVVVEEEKVLPAVNDSGELVGLWNRAQLVRVWEKMPQVSNWRPPRVSISAMQSEQKVKHNIHSDIKTTGLPYNEPSKEIPILRPEEISIVALETIPIPMIALDTSGRVLFHNQEWMECVQTPTTILMKTARSKMAELAFSGELSLDSVFTLNEILKDTEIKMKAMVLSGKDSVATKAVGYLFWIDNQGRTKKKQGHRKEKEFSHSDNLGETHRFLGRTLQEILSEEERKVLSWAMKEAGDNQSNAAMLLGIPRQTFAYRYKKLFS